MGYKVRHTFTYNGKRHDIRGNSEKEVALKIRKLIEKLDAEAGVVQSNITVAEYALHCYETYRRPSVKPLTYDKYMQKLNANVIRYIGDMRVKDVRRINCQQILNNLAGKSKYHISQTAQMLRFIFSQAVIDGLIKDSPADAIIIPAGTYRSRRALTEDEERVFLEVALKDPKYNIFLISFYCGCRPSEARSCIGSDIVQIQGRNMLHIRGTKNKSSDRFVPLHDNLYDRICKTPQDRPICPNEAGNIHNEKSYQRSWKSLKRDMNISMGASLYRNQLVGDLPLADDLTPYCLRHTYCTNLQRYGVDIRTAQRLMGHSDITMTANIYTHVDMSQIILAADLMDSCGK